MHTLNLANDILVFYVEAKTFPEDVQHAHKELHALIAYNPLRNYFGVSYGQKQGVRYLAAAAELTPGELVQYNLPKFRIKKGTYAYCDIDDFMQKIPLIGETFELLLDHPDLDPTGYCLEWYLDQRTCRCLVKLNDIE